MPKITWDKKRKPVNYLAALFNAYKRANNLNSDQIAEMTGYAAPSVRAYINRAPETWNVGKLMSFCDAIGVPYMEAFEACAKSRPYVGRTEKRREGTK